MTNALSSAAGEYIKRAKRAIFKSPDCCSVRWAARAKSYPDASASRLPIRPYGALGKYRFGNFATTVYSGSTTFATVLSATCPSSAYASSFPNP